MVCASVILVATNSTWPHAYIGRGVFFYFVVIYGELLSSWTDVKDLRCNYFHSSLKSFRSLFSSSINLIFFSLFHHFIIFSYSIASIIVGNSWNRTNLWTQYFLVNHSNIHCLCCKILCSKLLVTHVYNTHHFLDARI